MASGGVVVLAGTPLPVPSARLFRVRGSPSLAIHLHVGGGIRCLTWEPSPMTKNFARRVRHTTLTLGSLVAIALTLAAGLKW